MRSDLALVRELQLVDDRIQELKREIGRLPKYIAEIERKLESHKKTLEADRAALAENRKSHRFLEGEVVSFEQKASRLREQMREAKTNEQFRAFQNEIHYAEEEIRRIEDNILDKMVEAETLEKNVQAAEEALRVESKEVAKEIAETRARVAEDERELAAAKARRREISASIAADVLGTYERIRKTRGGVAVAEARADRCLACNVVFRPQFSQILRRNERVLTCESCGRILYYMPPEEERVETQAGNSTLASG